MIKGIELIYGDRATHSFLGRQIRGLLLFSFASVAWLVAVALSWPLKQWITSAIVSGPTKS
jgi:membrane protein